MLWCLNIVASGTGWRPSQWNCNMLNTRPYRTIGHWFKNIYVYAYLKILTWSGLIIYYKAPFPRACALNWYSVQCCHTQIYQVLFIITKELQAELPRGSCLLHLFLYWLYLRAEVQKTTFSKLHNTSVNNIPFKTARKFFCPDFVSCYPLRQTGVKLRIFSWVLNPH